MQVGKTVLLERGQSGKFEEKYNATIAVDYKNKVVEFGDGFVHVSKYILIK